MKKALIILALIASTSFTAEAQRVPLQTQTSPGELFLQLLSFKPLAAGAYYGTLHSTAPNGTQLDTTCSGCRQDPLRVANVKIVRGATATKDSAKPNAIFGQGKISISWNCWKAQVVSTTVNPICVGTVYRSDDMYSWSPASGLGASTLTPTAMYSATVTAAPHNVTWQLFDKNAYFYMVNVACTVDTAVSQVSLHYIKDQQVMLPAN